MRRAVGKKAAQSFSVSGNVDVKDTCEIRLCSLRKQLDDVISNAHAPTMHNYFNYLIICN